MSQNHNSTGASADAIRPDGGEAAVGSSTPGPKGALSLRPEQDLLAFLAGLLQQYGDCIRYETRLGSSFVFIHPEHVHAVLQSEDFRRASLVKLVLGEGLLASDGAYWKRQRRLTQRHFLPQRVAAWIPLMEEEIRRTAETWRAAAIAGSVVDIATEMTRLTLRIVVRCLFSHDLAEAASRELCEAVTRTLAEVGRLSWTTFGVPIDFTPARNADFSAANRVIDSLCLELIAQRRSVPPSARPPDILTVLIEADPEGGGLSDVQLRDELMTLLVGGHETTALGLAWAWKLLAERPELEARLLEETARILGAGSTDPAVVDMLPWSRAIFREALRLYPPVWFTGRVALREHAVGPHLVPRGASVITSAWFTHRHPAFWSRPESFEPARFVGEASGEFDRRAYFPFGGGRHTCLGMHFGLLEGTLALAQLARQFRVRPVNAAQVRPHPGITLRQAPGLLGQIELVRGCSRATAGEGG